MSSDPKLGRPAKPKSWELHLRHTFRASYIEDPELHALMFVCGSNFNAIVKRALMEFAVNNDLATQSHDFQSRLYVSASNLINTNREIPNSNEVLADINELHILERIGDLAGQPFETAPKAQKPTSVRKKVDQPQRPPAAPVQAPPSQKVTESTEAKPRLPLPAMDFGPEMDEEALMSGADSEFKKPPLKDRWLKKHNY